MNGCKLTGCWLPAATAQLVAQFHDQLPAQQQPAAAAIVPAQCRMAAVHKALIMGGVVGASLLLTAAWRGVAEERRHAARQ